MNRRPRSNPFPLWAAALLAVVMFSPAVAAAEVRPGIYAGWAYIDGGGDFPLRLEVGVEQDGPSVAISLPHVPLYGLTTRNAVIDAAGLRFERENQEGKLWRYRASPTRDGLAGEAVLDGDGARFTFELHRAHEALAMRPLENHDAYVGTYRNADGETVVISSWFWGELRFFDTKTGRAGTLFQTGDGDFIAGGANYVPHPVFARIKFDRNEDAELTGLTWLPETGGSARFERVRFASHAVTFASGGASLVGTLLTPAGDGPFPLVVVVGGSGWRTRDQNRQEADIFVSLGLAAFIYDKRGYGDSTGDAICAFDQTAADICAAIGVLRRRADIDGERVGLFGVSRGGWLAPLAASQCGPHVDFLVLFVAPAISPAAQETTRRLNEMRLAGFSETDVEAAARYLERLFGATESDAGWEAYQKALAKVGDQKWLGIVGAYDGRDNDVFRWNQLNMQYDPTAALADLRCPVLALFGENDHNVTPEQNVPLMRAALDRAGNTDVVLTVLPRADHGLRPVEPGTTLPLHKSPGYVPGVWTTVRDWLSTRAIVREQAAVAP